ncbi:NUDIX hydrolase [Flavobacterium franklandianum]|uniref:CoA pyrophosphatase n=1 Tax=Flavobacterium franklandianum TaxID=2594430 RepID=A0A553C6Y1_9FLAO|nr:CoA pyrophosphatase [Flavobacterium franklandianum]TRX16279.1 CoA pyrophosphatase [Flavobacterium franklandianum]
MDFQDFLEYVPKLVAVTLPAKEAHFKMAPLERIESLKNLNFDSINPKNAAVMMLFYPKKGRTHLVLIVRNSYEGVHSAQIAFPGGKYETLDVTFEKTALRETHEEIGIHPESIEIIMPFTNLYIQPSNFMVYPFLGICKDEIVFTPDRNEVVNIIELPLNDFLNDDLIITTTMSTSYAKNIEIPAFKINEYIVWGATAMMLNELKEVLKKVL